MGGVQYGIPLRGYESSPITPRRLRRQRRAASQASAESFGKSYAAFTGRGGCPHQPGALLQRLHDAGNVYRRMREYNPTRLFRSVGAGIAVISPLGPIGLDLGYGLDKVDLAGRRKPSWQLHFRLGNFF
jgi:outer membrane protein insertion porin family